MRRVLLASIFLSAAGSALGDEAHPAPNFDWTGFYVGGHAGWLGGDVDGTFTVTDPDFAPYTGTMHERPQSGLIGVQAGYLLDLRGLILGVEGDLSAVNIDAEAMSDPFFDGKGEADLGYSMDWLGTVRGRAGFGDSQGFIYLTGGLAYGRLTESYIYNYDTNNNVVENGAPYNIASSKGFETGWVAGGGLERMIDDKWSVRAEFLHIDLGDQHLAAEPVDTAALRTENVAFSSRFNMLRISASYHFH